MDKAARAAQIARCIAHTGDAFAYTRPGAAVVSFAANPQDEPQPSDAEGRRLGPQAPRLVRLTAARSLFSARMPVTGEHFTDSAGRSYRIVELPDSDLNSPTVAFLCKAPSA